MPSHKPNDAESTALPFERAQTDPDIPEDTARILEIERSLGTILTADQRRAYRLGGVPVSQLREDEPDTAAMVDLMMLENEFDLDLEPSERLAIINNAPIIRPKIELEDDSEHYDKEWRSEPLPVRVDVGKGRRQNWKRGQLRSDVVKGQPDTVRPEDIEHSLYLDYLEDDGATVQSTTRVLGVVDGRVYIPSKHIGRPPVVHDLDQTALHAIEAHPENLMLIRRHIELPGLR